MNSDENELDDFDFVDHYDDSEEVKNENMLEDNAVECALNCAFVGIGGGGGHGS